jgi:pimeloyl-ACP methyl ester carboxylesterase
MMHPQQGVRSVKAVRIPVGRDVLVGDLGAPLSPHGLVVFAHGSGSSRHSRRNQRVAHALEHHGFATLLIDLLTEAEEVVDAETGHLRFDIGLLARRVEAVVDWAAGSPGLRDLPIGLFGASTGAAAALVAAATRPHLVRAVVSRGGRPDLAGDMLSHVAAPTLLIVGSLDVPVVAMNRDALARMPGEVALEIVPGATHLFEEPGALERVADLAARWFERMSEGATGPTAGRRG